MPTNTESYNTLEEIQLRRNQLSEAIEHDRDLIADKWGELFKTNENPTKGEFIATLITNSITAIDAFLLARKMMKNYSGLFKFFGKAKKEETLIRSQHKKRSTAVLQPLLTLNLIL
jgi:hypothetical protein